MPSVSRLVRDFYGFMEVIQDDDSGIILQTTISGHIIKIDPHLISSIIGVLVLDILGVQFLDILEQPSLDNLMNFFNAHPQGEE